MQIHMRGVDLVVELLDAAEQIDHVEKQDLQKLLREASDLLAKLLARDSPDDMHRAGQP